MLDDLWVSKYNDIKVYAIEEGSEVKDMEPVIGIVGNPAWFAHLETPTLGVLAQQSSVATSVRRALSKLDPSKNLYFFPARFRHYVSQAADGYASVIAGGKDMSTDANGEYWGYTGLGTIPHLLIAAYGGDTAKAALKFDEYVDPKVNRIVLVDWDNDCIGTTLKVLKAFLIKLMFREMMKSATEADPEMYVRSYSHLVNQIIGEGKGKIYGVRFDTSGSLWDKSVSKVPGTTGVSPELVIKAREKFDSLGLKDLKIMVSGGFDEEKLGFFKKMGVPYDVVGIGSSIVNKFTVDFTADAVVLNGQPCAKVGRSLQNWGKLIRKD
jgi:nicotinate phosphoribosyltransferase